MKKRIGMSWFMLSKENPTIRKAAELKQLLKVLDYQPETDLIQNGLDYFRNCHTVRPISYPGDSIFYEIFMDGMKKGLNQKDAHSYTKGIIDREMKLIDATMGTGMVYITNWLENPAIKLHRQ